MLAFQEFIFSYKKPDGSTFLDARHSEASCVQSVWKYEHFQRFPAVCHKHGVWKPLELLWLVSLSVIVYFKLRPFVQMSQQHTKFEKKYTTFQSHQQFSKGESQGFLSINVAFKNEGQMMMIWAQHALHFDVWCRKTTRIKPLKTGAL